MVNEIFSINKEQTKSDKFMYQILALEDKDTRQTKKMLYCTFLKRLNDAKEKYWKYAEKDDKDNTLTLWIMSEEASKISFCLKEYFSKKIFTKEEMRKTFDYLKSVKANIDTRNEKWTEFKNDKWEMIKTKDSVTVTLSSFRVNTSWFKVINFILKFEIVSEWWEQYFKLKSWRISASEKNDKTWDVKSFFTKVDFFEMLHILDQLDSVKYSS